MLRLKFRHRIGLLVALAAAALITVAAVTLLLGRRSEDQLSGIETRYVPLLELDRDLKTTFKEIPRALEDAATAADETKLREADQLAAQLAAQIAGGARVIADNGDDPAALRAEFERYYERAREISAALVAGTAAARIADRIEAMHRAQQAFTNHLDLATTPDRTRLTAAFATARESQHTALWIDIIVACIALALMALLSWRIIRRTVGALEAVSAGVERLARGEFGHEIDVTTDDELGDLARRANRTAVRLRDYRELEQAMLRETQRQAAAVATANKELEAFSYSVSHDLRAPLRGIDGFSQVLLEDHADALAPKAQEYLRRIRAAAQRMAELIDDLLRLSRVSRADLRRERVDVSAVAAAVAADLQRGDPGRSVDVVVQPDVVAFADRRLVQIMLENLIGNAWKFTAKTPSPRIEVGVRDQDGAQVYFVRDNGAGFDMKYAERLFTAFHRLHSEREFAGTGIGLATVHRVIVRHGGRIWVDAAIGEGATFQFTLPQQPEGAAA